MVRRNGSVPMMTYSHRTVRNSPRGLFAGKSSAGQRAIRHSCRLATAGIRLMPDFIIIGTQRGGTTSLYKYLTQHPDIGTATNKEVHFFDLNFHRGTRWYRYHFPTVVPRLTRQILSKRLFLTGEGSPYYLFHPLVPGRVAEALPSLKLIVLLRNPIDRAYSHYQHEVRQGRESLTFEEAIRQEDKRMVGEHERILNDGAYASTAHRRHSYLARGIYVDQLDRWMRCFPPEQFLVIRSEDFYANPQAILSETLRFLGVSDYKLQGYRRYQSAEYAGMDSAVRQRLREYFAPHNQRLYKFLGTELSWDD